jgi:methionyl-tRNA formyltransferase
MIRAVAEPYPGAFVGDGLARVHRWAASIHEDSATGAAPGTVVEIVPARGVAVAPGRGILLITRVQSAGGIAEPADRWAARRAVRPGTRL